MVVQENGVSLHSSASAATAAGPVKSKGSSEDEKSTAALRMMVHVENLRDSSTVVQTYGRKADSYDQDFSSDKYKGPVYTAEAIASLFPAERRPDVKILDVAAGTGKVGEELFALGFRMMDALDGSAQMLSILKERGFYGRAIQELISREKRTAIESDVYDVTSITGAFIPGHVPFTSLEEMCRVTKAGGYIVISMRREFLKDIDYVDMEPYLDKLEAAGLWTRVETRVVPEFFYAKDGMLFVLRKK